jgi:hypothetical protein
MVYATRDIILLNYFPLNDSAIILLGRIGFCFTLLFGLPHLVTTLPLQRSVSSDTFIDCELEERCCFGERIRRSDHKRRKVLGAHFVINGVEFDETEPVLVTDDPEKQHTTMLTCGATHSMERVPGVSESLDYSTESGTDEKRSIGLVHDNDEDDCRILLHCSNFCPRSGFRLEPLRIFHGDDNCVHRLHSLLP